MNSENNSRPNYRIYDRTGGGVTQDIHAESLEAAIAAGREWIESGDWSGGDNDDSDVIARCRTIALRCEVGEIIYARAYTPRVESNAERTASYLVWGPRRMYLDDLDTASIAAIKAAVKDLGPVFDEDELESAIDSEVDDTEGAEAVSLDWEDYPENTDAGEVTAEIDEDATDAADRHDCSGSYTDDEPDCPVSEGWDFVGTDTAGLDEFGCRSHGGTRMTSYEVCRNTGIYRDTLSAGCQCNPDEPSEVITYRERDAASEAYVVEHHEADGWIPEWLAEYLGRPMTTRYTEETAKEWVADHTDEDLDAEDLEHVFAAIFGRRADDQDRTEGLWSHVNA